MSRLIVWLVISLSALALWHVDLLPRDRTTDAIWFSALALVFHWFLNILMGIKETKKFTPINLPEDDITVVPASKAIVENSSPTA